MASDSTWYHSLPPPPQQRFFEPFFHPPTAASPDTAMVNQPSLPSKLPPTLPLPYHSPRSRLKRKANTVSTDVNATIQAIDDRLMLHMRIPAAACARMRKKRRAERIAAIGVMPEKPELVGWPAGDASVQMVSLQISSTQTILH